MTVGRRFRWLVIAVVATGAMLACGWTWRQSHRYRATLLEARQEMAAGRNAMAARKLTELLDGTKGRDEAAYLLGVCEQTRGRNDAAAAAWARVTPGSAFSARAISARMTLAIDAGRLAAAEELMNEAARDPRNDGTALRILLLPTFTQQGRLDDAERLVVERWEHLRDIGEETSELAINLARLHSELRWTPIPVDDVRASLSQAARLAPDDDRVWLGQANLAIRTGHAEQAEPLLDACLKRRPEDPAVWRAHLSWGMAVDRVDVVQQALAHLPVDDYQPALSHRVAAWLAANHGTVNAERVALERLIEADPTDFKALDRLIELAQTNDRANEAVSLKNRRAEITRLEARYRKLHDRNQPIRDAAELGRLAEQLGRPFETRIYLSVAASQGFRRAEARRELLRLKAKTKAE